MDGIRSDWLINYPFGYLLAVAVLALGVRVVLSILRALKLAHEADGSFRTFLVMVHRNILGIHPKETGSSSDYGYTLIIGMLELSIYPILTVINAWVVIGAWIGLKALAQRDVWGTDRAVFNLFLIGNAVNVVVAFFALSHFITVPDVGLVNAPSP